MSNAYCVIMAGGLGKRFWPVSSKNCPKQFCDIMNVGRSFLQQTYDRARLIFEPHHILVVTGAAYKEITRQQLPEIPEGNILLEPFGKNTAPCIAYAAYKIAALDPEAAMVVVPSDHLIFDNAVYRDNILQGLAFIGQNGGLLTIGIPPTRPETGYGYIQVKKGSETQQVSKVKTFTEKPDLELANVFLKSGDFLWNAGIFMWKVSDIIREFQRHLEDIWFLFESEYANAAHPDSPENIEHIYSQCSSISIDFGILERSPNVYVIRGGFGWSDVGTWHAFHELSPKDDRNNVSNTPRVLFPDSRECIVNVSEGKKVIIQGISNCIIAEREDILMICNRDYEENIRHFEDMLKQREKEIE